MTAPAVPTPLALALPRPASRRALRRAVLDWFDRRGRALVFRERPGPWGVLVSEVMAQQTQIGRVAERWPALVSAFPTPSAMAAASPADVIRAWRGLGYNRRALNLHRAATAIVAGGGAVPADVQALRALPGVGPYTARAVAAIAFGRPVGAVDVNVRRVLGRILAGDPAAVPPPALQVAADALVDPGRPGDWTHALMDLGATVCRPARPDCATCPARRWCRAAADAGRAPTPAPAERARARAPARGPRARRAPGPGPGAGEPLAAAPGPAAWERHPAAPAPGTPGREPVPFERTSRWLRGRIVERLRDAPPGGSIVVAGPIGSHAAEDVVAALRALAAEGMVDMDADGRARLPAAASLAVSTRSRAAAPAARGGS